MALAKFSVFNIIQTHFFFIVTYSPLGQIFHAGVWLNSLQIIPHGLPSLHLYTLQNFVNVGNVKNPLQFQAHTKLQFPSAGHKFHFTPSEYENPTLFVFPPEIHFSFACLKKQQT
jgi:hypothetical protein